MSSRPSAADPPEQWPTEHESRRTGRVLITGAGGGIGVLLRRRLAGEGRILRLFDIAEQEPAEPGERVEIRTGSVTDLDAMTAACRDVDAVIHLGGNSREAPWEDILSANIDGTRNVLEAMRVNGVRRVVLASSNHAVGFWTRAEAGSDGIAADARFRPDTYYGVGKVALEALGSLYHHRFGMEVLCLRIGSCFPHPGNVRGLTTWLSPDDAHRLFEACLRTESPGFRLIWGVSANTRGIFSLAEGRAIGFHPQDDAEVFANELLNGPEAESDPASEYVGGPFTTAELGRPN